MVIALGFSLLVSLGAWFDARERRVPNILVGVLLIGGMLLAVVRSPTHTPWFALQGLAVGFLCWLPWWAIGMLGAGDVKFFAASAAWLGPVLAWRSTLVAAVLGGIWCGWQLAFRHSRLHGTPPSSRTVPYAIPMAVALLLAMVVPHWFAIL